MSLGFSPHAMSCTQRRLLKVVLPLEEGPAMSTIFASGRSAILSAMRLIRFS